MADEQAEQPKVIDKTEAINAILILVSNTLDTEVVLVADETNKTVPNFDVNGFVSKLIALFVYAGLNVPTSSLTPPYNKIHADVEYWKKKFEK